MALDTGSISSRERAPVYSGSEVLAFGVAQMPPNIRIYSYVNGVNITPFTAPFVPANAKAGEPIYTDASGSALGQLYIPSTQGQYKFLSGEIRITFCDSPDGVENSKFFSETILYNHGITLADVEQGNTVALRRMEKIGEISKNGVTAAGIAATASADRIDPLSQTFFIDQTKYPLGAVVLGVGLFFYTKDDKLPISIELRPMNNGKPSTTEYFSGSFVAVSADAVKVYDTNKTPPSEATPFIFQHPIFLLPGEYAITVMTKSDKYEILSNNISPTDTAAANTSKQAGVGSLFKAQNTGDWTPNLNEDLAFYVLKAKFKTGSAVFEMQTSAADSIEYNKIRILSSDISMGETAYVGYEIQTTNAGSRTVNSYQRLAPNDSPENKGRQVLSEEGDAKLRITLTSKSADVSPILDKQLITSQVFKNAIYPYTEELSNSELNPYHGTAAARYISKVVRLQEDFDSTGVEVKVSVNRKVGTEIEVFCRVLSRLDNSSSNGINDRPFVRLPLYSPTTKSFAGTSDDLYTTETYRLLDFTYNSTSNNVISGAVTTSQYQDFAYYQVKVVFYAQDPTYLPKIRNLTATALL
jgi:hypothetical protein